MTKPKWFKKGVSILRIFLYTGDVGSDIWVGVDLILRCHYKFAASVLIWVMIPGFIQGWVEFFGAEQECYLTNVLKALLFPFFLLPYTLYRMIKAAMDVDDEDRIFNAKV